MTTGIGAKSEAAVTDSTADASVIAILKGSLARLADIRTAIQLLDNAVSGSEYQVDVVAALPAGENHVGQVGGEGTTITQTPTVTAGAYTAGDAVGGLLTFANAARVSGGGGVIKNMLIVDDAGQDAELELWLFNQTFTALSDNAPWAPAEADLENLICILTTSDGAWFAAGTPSAARVEASQRYDLTGTSMFGRLVTRGTPTFAATDDVTIKIGLLQD